MTVSVGVSFPAVPDTWRCAGLRPVLAAFREVYIRRCCMYGYPRCVAVLESTLGTVFFFFFRGFSERPWMVEWGTYPARERRGGSQVLPYALL